MGANHQTAENADVGPISVVVIITLLETMHLLTTKDAETAIAFHLCNIKFVPIDTFFR